MKNYFAFRQAGRFGGWPANNGVWIWGDEILVGFELGYHDPETTGGHAILGTGVLGGCEQTVQGRGEEKRDQGCSGHPGGIRGQDPFRATVARVFAAGTRAPSRVRAAAPGQRPL